MLNILDRGHLAPHGHRIDFCENKAPVIVRKAHITFIGKWLRC